MVPLSSIFPRKKDGPKVHPGSECGKWTPGLFPTPHCGLCIFILSLYKYPQGLRFLSAARPVPLNSCNVSPTPVTEPFCSQARPTFFTLRVGRGTQKGEPHTSVQRGKLRHRAGLTEGQGPGVVSRSSKKPRAAGKAAGGETLFCFLKLPAGTESTKSSL